MSLPLAGIRVADFSWIINGPQIAQWLATMGAEVIKIESQVYIDIGRTNPAGMADRISGVNRSGFYHALNYGKKAISLNLGNPKGRDLAHTSSCAAATSYSNVSPDPPRKNWA
jgi:benzylsuccinate CoA-transferase BbsF subunit